MRWNWKGWIVVRHLYAAGIALRAGWRMTRAWNQWSGGESDPECIATAHDTYLAEIARAKRAWLGGRVVPCCGSVVPDYLQHAHQGDCVSAGMALDNRHCGPASSESEAWEEHSKLSQSPPQNT